MITDNEKFNAAVWSNWNAMAEFLQRIITDKNSLQDKLFMGMVHEEVKKYQALFDDPPWARRQKANKDLEEIMEDLK